MSEEEDVVVSGGGGQQHRVKRVRSDGVSTTTPPSSRLVVKNLPKSITEEKLRRHFSSQGGVGVTVTDVRLGRWDGGSGEFRGFGYVGFRTEEEAKKAKEHFHRSFVGGGRVDVDFWVPRDLRDRAQSKRARREHKEVEVGQKKKQHQIENLKEKVPKLEEEILARAREDKDFAEFLGVNKVAQKTNMWANDDDDVTTNAEAKEEEKVRFAGDSSDSDDSDSEPATATATAVKKKQSMDLFTLKLVDLPRSVRKSDVRKLFSPFASLSSVRLPRNSRGFGFVGFKDEAEGRRAQKTKDKSVLKGGVVRVKVYKETNQQQQEKKKGGQLDEEVVESVGESGRIYVRNLGYDVTEEELRGVFQKFGPLVEVFIPVDGVSGRNKGYGFVGFMMPGDAERALGEVDGRGVLQGRVLHLLPAKEKPIREEEGGGGGADGNKSSFKKGKLVGMKKGEAEKGKMRGWNTLFVNMVAVSELMGRKYGVGREELLLAGGSNNSEEAGRRRVESAGVRLALGESEVVSSVEKFLVEQGVCLAAFDGENVKRSDKVILARNLPVDVGEAELRGVFEKYGVVEKVVVPEFGVCAIVEFKEKGEAKKAFRGVAYSKFRGSVVFLEWAPVGVFEGAAPGSRKEEQGEEEDNVRGVEEKVEKVVVVSELPRVGEDEMELTEPEEGTTVFVKNLSWETSEERLKQVFGEVGVVSGVRLAVKLVGDKVLSQGYGFVQFWRRGDAVRAVGVLNGRMIDNHNILVNESKKTLFVKKKGEGEGVEKVGGGTIISVKNVPFQATQEEVADLFRVFGPLKGVRMPVKVLGEAGHRGFAFVEFLKEEHAKSSLGSLGRSCHLYGRRLVLSWAEKTGDNLELAEELQRRRKRVAASAAAATSGAASGSASSSVGPSLKRGMQRYFDKKNISSVQGEEEDE